MSRSANLYALQQTDSETDTRTERLAEVNELLGETDELLAARQRLEKAGEALSEWRIEQRDQELALQSLDRKRRSSVQRLYGGTVRNPKELSDLQEEVASLNRRRAVIEDELLETMLLVEEGEAEEAEAIKSLNQIEGRWRAEQAELQAEKEALEKRLAALATVRLQQIAVVSPADRSGYQHLRLRKGGLAVAALKGAECQGCMTTVSAARVKEARSDALAHCGNCGRILFASREQGQGTSGNR